MNDARFPPGDAPPPVFSRRRRRRSLETQGSSSSSKQEQHQHQQQQHAAAAASAVVSDEEMGTIAQETPASPARAFTPSSHAAAAARLIQCRSSKSSSYNSSSWSSRSDKGSISSTSSSTDARDQDQDEQQSEVPSVHPVDHAAEVIAATAARPAPAAAAAKTPAAAATTAARVKRGTSWFAVAKKVLFPSQLQAWLLLLLLLQHMVLLGLWMQRRHLQQEKEDLQQHAVSLQLLYEQGEQRLLNSRRSRLGLKQQQQEQREQQREYCRCRPCARLQQSAEYIDLNDRFKHTQRDVELSVQALLRCMDTAATSLEETYEGTLNLPWKRRLEDKLTAMQDG